MPYGMWSMPTFATACATFHAPSTTATTTCSGLCAAPAPETTVHPATDTTATATVCTATMR